MTNFIENIFFIEVVKVPGEKGEVVNTIITSSTKKSRIQLFEKYLSSS